MNPFFPGRGAHWAAKRGTEAEPKPWRFNKYWADERTKTQRAFMEYVQGCGLGSVIFPWDLPGMRAVGNQAKCIWMRLQMHAGMGHIEFEGSPDVSQGFFGILGFRVLNKAEFNAGPFPLPSGYEACRREFCRKTIVRLWHAIGMKEFDDVRGMRFVLLRRLQIAGQRIRTDNRRKRGLGGETEPLRHLASMADLYQQATQPILQAAGRVGP